MMMIRGWCGLNIEPLCEEKKTTSIRTGCWWGVVIRQCRKRHVTDRYGLHTSSSCLGYRARSCRQNVPPSTSVSTVTGAILLEISTFVALDGLNSGVPTRTTPTLTPTTLRNIEQTFLELQSETTAPAAHLQHSAQAGFVPPVVHSTSPQTQQVTGGGGSMYLNTESKGGWGGGNTNIGRIQASPSPALTPSPTPQQAPTRRNMGGRRPIKDDKISPEEEERRKVRRERNKLAAARCRKRRLDHTNELLMETEGLEQKKQCLQSEIQQLQREKEELEFILEAHKPCCRLLGPPSSPPDVKPPRQQLQSRPLPKLLPVLNKPPQRPSSLPVAAFTPAKHGGGGALSEVAGVPITTPSAGIPFNFDSLMEGGTGLTPVSGVAPTCSSQQRSSEGNVASAAAAGDLATSPDASNHAPPKLVSL